MERRATARRRVLIPIVRSCPHMLIWASLYPGGPHSVATRYLNEKVHSATALTLNFVFVHTNLL